MVLPLDRLRDNPGRVSLGMVNVPTERSYSPLLPYMEQGTVLFGLE